MTRLMGPNSNRLNTTFVEDDKAILFDADILKTHKYLDTVDDLTTTTTCVYQFNSLLIIF